MTWNQWSISVSDRVFTYFYREFPLDEDNIFSANLTENDKVEQISFETSKLCPINGLSLDQGTASNVSLPNIEGKETLSDILKTYVEEKNKFNLDLKTYKEDYFDMTVSYVKRTDVLIDLNIIIQQLKKKKHWILQLLRPP